MHVHMIPIDGTYAVRITPGADAVRLELLGGFAGIKWPIFVRDLTLAQARQLGDALGFASNDAGGGHAQA